MVARGKRLWEESLKEHAARKGAEDAKVRRPSKVCSGLIGW